MEANSKDFLKNLTSKIGSGATPRGGSNAYKASGISLIRSQNIRDFKFTYDGLAFIDEEQAKLLDSVAVFENDILLNITGDSIARACIVPRDILPARVNQHVSIVRCKDKDEADYILCYLQYLKKHLLTICKVGGTRNALTKEAIENIEIRKAFNHKIRGKLVTKINTKIELNNRINTELEQMAKTLYDYWFVQFDFPFDFAQGKPNEQGKPYKSSGGKMVYNKELKREIPEGWEVNNLSDIANIAMGQSPAGSSYNDNGIGTMFFQGSTDFGWRYPTIRQYTTAPSRFAKAGDILLSVRAPVGTINIADNNCCIGRGLAALNSKDGFTSYLFYVMEYFKRIFDYRNSAGTTFGAITKDDLYTLKVIKPQNELLEKYDKVVSNYNKMILVNHKQNQQLTSLRDWLLPMLMNGQVTVREAEEKLDMAAEPETQYKFSKQE